MVMTILWGRVLQTGQEIPRSVHNSPPLIPTLSQTNPLHTDALCLLRTLQHYLPSYAYGFPTKTMHVFLPHSCHIPLPSALSTNHEAPRHATLPNPCHLLPLQLKHPALQPIFESLQPTLFP